MPTRWRGWPTTRRGREHDLNAASTGREGNVSAPLIPEPPPHGAAAHGLPVQPDWAAVARELHGLNLITAPRQRKALSRDFHWYSPILEAELADCVADLVVKPSTEAEVLRIAAVAARHRVPLTVRGGGTGNYGQCVPLAGGLVLDCTEMQRVLDIGDGFARVQGGAKLWDIDQAARESIDGRGQSLRIWPSTWRVATVAGFIAGGFGGIGSTAHGVLRDVDNLRSCRVVTVEPEPRVIVLEGADIQKVHHAYGTNGIITEVTLALRPAVDWVHCIALFPRHAQVLAAAGEASGAGSRPALDAALMSCVEARFARFYPMLGGRFPADRHALFAMVAPAAMDAFRAIVEAEGGALTLAMTEPELDAAGLPPASDCAYNHTTLQALKADPGPGRRWTYLQVAYPQPFDPAIVERQLARFGDEVLQHQEFAQMYGQPATFGLLLVRWTDAARQYALIESIERDGCTIFNPHVVTIEDGGMKTIDQVQIEFKKQADPLGLMNPGKTRGWTPAMARSA
jgi:FAD/FMN-containing dehydrogenase